MNDGISTALTFGIDEIEDGQFMAYVKTPGIPTDVVFATVLKQKNDIETIFTLSDVVIDAEKVAEKGRDENSGATSQSQEELGTLRVHLLVEFLNKMVKAVLLEEVGSTRLILPYFRGVSDNFFKDVKDGIKSADDVIHNMRSRQLILICL